MISTGNLTRTQVSVRRTAYEVYSANIKLRVFSCLSVCTHAVRAESEELLQGVSSNLIFKINNKRKVFLSTPSEHIGGGGGGASPLTDLVR